MPTIEEVMSRIERTPDCSLLPPAGQPQLVPGKDHRLPDDMRRFYEVCGGARLYTSSGYGFTVVPPEQVVPVDMDLLGKVYESDISASWYVAARLNVSVLDILSIDLAPERLSRCYCSFVGNHREAGDCPIVATSLTDLLGGLLDEQGRYLFWWEPGFEPLGDAYDGYEDNWVAEELGG
jgi:antitoxin YokJ